MDGRGPDSIDVRGETESSPAAPEPPESDGATRRAVETVASEPSNDQSDSGLATLPFTGLALVSLALLGLAQLSVGATLRRLIRRASRPLS
jgi:hypothetical protein